MPGQDFWQQAWDQAQPQIEAIRSSLGTGTTPLVSQSVQGHVKGHALRIGQLDAELLDHELLQLLKEPVSKPLRLISSRWSSSLEPELMLILQIILYKYSIWESGATYGAKLQNLRYKAGRNTPRNGRSRIPKAPSGIPATLLLAHATFTIGIPYANKRVRAHALSSAWPDAPSFDRRKMAWDMLLKAESAHSALSLLSFILFLWNGRYRTISDRLFGLRLVPISNLMNRNVSYEFMNRQMVWHAFTEFLLFVLPIINTRALRRRLSQSLNPVTVKTWISLSTWTHLLPPLLRPQAADSSHLPTEGLDLRNQKKGKYWQLPDNECAICAVDAAVDLSQLSTTISAILPSEPAVQSMPSADVKAVNTAIPPSHPINNPYMTSCWHLYCYVCISERFIRAADEAEKYWECLRCDEKVYHANRWDPIRNGNRRSHSDQSNRSFSASAGDEGGADGGNVTRQRLGPATVTSTSHIGGTGYGNTGTGTGTSSELDDSELSAMDLDSVSSIGLRTQSDFDSISD